MFIYIVKLRCVCEKWIPWWHWNKDHACIMHRSFTRACNCRYRYTNITIFNVLSPFNDEKTVNEKITCTCMTWQFCKQKLWKIKHSGKGLSLFCFAKWNFMYMSYFILKLSHIDSKGLTRHIKGFVGFPVCICWQVCPGLIRRWTNDILYIKLTVPHYRIWTQQRIN